MDCLDILITVILLTVNTSLLKGTIPKHLKCAAVKRLPKKEKKKKKERERERKKKKEGWTQM